MASRGVNKVILVGNIGQDPETRYTPSGSAITRISVATSETWKDKQTGQQQERTEWHRVVFFNRLAEIAGEYLRKGGKVYLEGALRTNKWQDQQGQDRYTTEIVANEMQMLDARGAQDGQGGGMGGGMNAGMGGGYGGAPAPQQAPAPQAAPTPQNAPQAPPAQQPQQRAPEPSFDSFDDDIPF